MIAAGRIAPPGSANQLPSTGFARILRTWSSYSTGLENNQCGMQTFNLDQFAPPIIVATHREDGRLAAANNIEPRRRPGGGNCDFARPRLIPEL
jgi:hypothetical protein